MMMLTPEIAHANVTRRGVLRLVLDRPVADVYVLDRMRGPVLERSISRAVYLDESGTVCQLGGARSVPRAPCERVSSSDWPPGGQAA